MDASLFFPYKPKTFKVLGYILYGVSAIVFATFLLEAAKRLLGGDPTTNLVSQLAEAFGWFYVATLHIMIANYKEETSRTEVH